MNFRNLFTLTLFALLSLSINAQSRENKPTLSFLSESPKLTKATGWQQNEETGKWVDNKNSIDDKEVKSYWVSHIPQNFTWINFRTLIKGDVKYYVFVFEKHSGSYKYPNIREGWEADKRTYFLAFQESDFNELKSQIESQNGENFIVKSKIFDYITNAYVILKGEHLYNEENLLAKISKTIDKPSYLEYGLVVNSQVTDGENIVRFRLPESIATGEDRIKEAYFEVSLLEFKSILNL